MGKIKFIILCLTLLVPTCVYASDLSNGVSLRNRHYATCMSDAIPAESFQIAGRYVISNARAKYVSSCSPNKHKMHRAMVAANNYQNYYTY